MEALDCDVKEADAVFICNTYQHGWGSGTCQLHHKDNMASDIRHGQPPATNILYHESLSVVLALAPMAQNPDLPHRVMIYTDNLGTVGRFHSMQIQVEKDDPEPFYHLLKCAADIFLDTKISLHALHIHG